MADLNRPVGFLTELYGATPAGLIVTWDKARKRSQYLKAPAGAASIPAGAPDIYYGVGLSPKNYGKSRRTAAAEVIAIPGFWADIDVNGGPDNKQNAAPDRDAALELAYSILEPTLLVDSGYGYQPLHLFEEPWVFTSTQEQQHAAQAVAQFQQLLRQRADFKIDATHDLARILRLPGTVNAKGADHKPVTVIHHGPRYPRQQLLELCETAGEVNTSCNDNGHAIAIGDIHINPDATVHGLDELCAHNPKFHRTWNHKRDDLKDQSTSGYDIALVSLAARAGWDNQQLTNLIVAHRRNRDPEDPKARRADYIASTIERARAETNSNAPASTSSPSSSSSSSSNSNSSSGASPAAAEPAAANDQDTEQPKPARRPSTRASEIKARRIRWVWQGRLARSYLSLWSGESSLGKSTLFCWLAKQLTLGNLDGHVNHPARALIVASEDAREDVWVPRLTIAGADLDLVEFQNQTRDWNIRDGVDLTAQALAGGDFELVFIDSIFEHMPPTKGGESIYATDYIRRALGPFADLCKARNVAGLISTHPPKGKGGGGFADHVLASAAFVQLTRVGMLFAWHPEDLELPEQDRRRVLLRPPGGSNIGRNPGALEYQIATEHMIIEGEPEEVPYITDPQPSEVTFRDLTRTPKDDAPKPTETTQARELIDERLADGKWHPSMIDELIAIGYSRSTAYRAAEPCQKKQASGGGWWWAAKDTPKDAFVKVGGILGPDRARARGSSRRGTCPPKHTENGSVETRSQDPTDFDEMRVGERVGGSGPTVGTASRARAREGDLTEDELVERFILEFDGEEVPVEPLLELAA